MSCHVEPVRAHLVRRLLAHVLDRSVDLLLRLLHDLLDAPRMDAAVGDELGERHARNLAAHRIEAGDDHRIRRIIDDDVDAGGELEGADVSPLAADDATLHLVVGQRHRRLADLGRVLGGDALHGERHDLLRLAVGVALG